MANVYADREQSPFSYWSIMIAQVLGASALIVLWTSLLIAAQR